MIIKLKSSHDIDLSRFGVDEVWIDLDSCGLPVREIGFFGGDVVHKFPGNGKYGTYGIFDLSKFEYDQLSRDETKEFDRVWNELE